MHGETARKPSFPGMFLKIGMRQQGGGRVVWQMSYSQEQELSREEVRELSPVGHGMVLH